MASCGWCGTTGIGTDHVQACRVFHTRRPSDAEMAEARRNLVALQERLHGEEPVLSDVYVAFLLRTRPETDLLDVFEQMARAVWERGEDFEILEVESDLPIPGYD